MKNNNNESRSILNPNSLPIQLFEYVMNKLEERDRVKMEEKNKEKVKKK